LKEVNAASKPAAVVATNQSFVPAMKDEQKTQKGETPAHIGMYSIQVLKQYLTFSQLRNSRGLVLPANDAESVKRLSMQLRKLSFLS
jgi:hypothetical protein